jgi:Icc-related predicted phosphoesterase
MKIIALSDTHRKHKQIYKWLEPADMIIHAGDITGGGYDWEIKDFFSWFSQLPYQYKICIAGNHDKFFEKKPEEARKLVPENVIYLEDSSVTIEGIKIYGSPVQPTFYNWAFNRNRGADIKAYWDKIEPDTNILVTHGPPFKILDYVEDGRLQKPYNQYDNVGCEDLLARVKELKDLKYHIFGHIHSGHGDHEEDGVKFMNASFLDEAYQPAYRPHIFEY